MEWKQARYYISQTARNQYRIGPFTQVAAARSVRNILHKYGDKIMESKTWTMFSDERKTQIRNVLRHRHDNLQIWKVMYGKPTINID